MQRLHLTYIKIYTTVLRLHCLLIYITGLQTILMSTEWRSFNRARLRLTRLTSDVHQWLVMVSLPDNSSSQKRIFMVPICYDETIFQFPFDLTAGQVYHIEAFGLGPYDGRVVCQNYTDCRAGSI